MKEIGGQMQKSLLSGVYNVSRVFNVIAGSALILLMLLTVADVFLRLFGRPIPGTYELVSFIGTVVFGLALSFTSWHRQHIFVDFFISKLPPVVHRGFDVATRIVVIALFFWFGWNMAKYGVSIQRSGEISSVLHMPFYPFAYALSMCCFVECVVLCCDIFKIFGGTFNE
jgi:TRAP-type C4-dicarboxylate transport system permease small subunit